MPVAAGFLGSDGLRESVVMSGQEYLVRPAGNESASPYQRVLLMASRPGPYPSPSPDELAIFTAAPDARSGRQRGRGWLSSSRASDPANVTATPRSWPWEALFGSTLQRAKRW